MIQHEMIAKKFLYSCHKLNIPVKNSYHNNILIDEKMQLQKIDLFKNMRYLKKISVFNEKLELNQMTKILYALKYGKKLKLVKFYELIRKYRNGAITMSDIFRVLFKRINIVLNIGGYNEDMTYTMTKKNIKDICRYGYYYDFGDQIEVPFRYGPCYLGLKNSHVKRILGDMCLDIISTSQLNIDISKSNSDWETNYRLPIIMQKIQKIPKLSAIKMNLMGHDDDLTTLKYIANNLPKTNELNEFSLQFSFYKKGKSISDKILELSHIITSIQKFRYSSSYNTYDHRIFNVLLQLLDNCHKIEDISITLKETNKMICLPFLFQLLSKYQNLKSLKFALVHYQHLNKYHPLQLNKCQIQELDLHISNDAIISPNHQLKIGKEICALLHSIRRFGCLKLFKLRKCDQWTSSFHKLLAQEIEFYPGLEKIDLWGFNHDPYDHEKKIFHEKSPFIYWDKFNINCDVNISFPIGYREIYHFTNDFFDGIFGIKGMITIHLHIKDRRQKIKQTLHIIYQNLQSYCNQIHQIYGEDISNQFQKRINIIVNCKQKCHKDQINAEQFLQQKLTVLAQNINWKLIEPF